MCKRCLQKKSIGLPIMKTSSPMPHYYTAYTSLQCNDSITLAEQITHFLL